MKRSRLALMGALAACGTDGLTEAQTRLRDAFVDTQEVTVGGLSGDVDLALRADVVYGADLYRIVQIDRATGTVDELLGRADARQVMEIAADDAAVYAIVASLEGVRQLVRVSKAGGNLAVLYAAPDDQTSLESLVVHDGTAYLVRFAAAGELVAIGGDGELRVRAALPALALTSIVAATDGIFYGLADGSLARLPYDGGAAALVPTGAHRLAYDLASDATGVYWNASDDGAAPTKPLALYFLATGSATPVELAPAVPRADFAVNDLGFYWSGYPERSVRALARADVGSGDFAVLPTHNLVFKLAVDDGAIVYASNDADSDLGDLELHVVPRRR